MNKPSNMPLKGARQKWRGPSLAHRILRHGALLMLLCAAPSHAAQLTQHRDPESSLLSWKQVDRGFSLELIQLLPDYVKALYSSRGLPKSVVDGMAPYCVFGSVVQNHSGGELSYRVADWRYVTADGKKHPLKTKTQWVADWKKQGSDFGWSILPAAMTFDSGDWAQGFTTVRLPPGSHFDLIYSWRHHGKHYTGTLKNLICAPAQPAAATP